MSSLNLIWKRPDGFHGATPADFCLINIEGHSNLWVHKKDKDTFPFRVSGGWEEELQTSRLNNLINLLESPDERWVEYLQREFHHTMKDDAEAFITETLDWLNDLKSVVKGGNWEVEIISQALQAVHTKVSHVQPIFLAKTKP